MKDIYELLNDVNIDENEFEEIQVNEIEKAKVKKTLKSSIKRKADWKKKAIVAASAGIIATATFGISFPSYAKNIPIVGDIFRALDNGNTGLYDRYKENANEINVTKESKGISITVNDAIFDGKTISLTYTIESKKDLGEELFFGGSPIEIKGDRDKYIGQAGDSQVVKVDENTYIGQDNITITNFIEDARERVQFELNIDKIITNNEEIKGNWNFEIGLDAVKGKTQVVNKSVEKEGLEATIKSLDINPMSMNIIYAQDVSKDIFDEWDDVYMDVELKDDLGNVYSENGSSGTGDIYGQMTCHKTFGKLKEGATKLIATPKVTLTTRTKDNSGGVEIDDNGKETPIVSEKTGPGERKEITLDEIVIELNK